MNRAILLTVLWSVLSVAPTTAAPLVFDFEDGLQGWELRGSAQRVQTQVLGGEWAIFGDGLLGASISRSDLSGFASVSVDVFFIDGDRVLEALIGISIQDVVFIGESLEFEFIDDAANPTSGTSELGSGILRIDWTTTPHSIGLANRYSVAFIDNVTFHPIPEPGHLGLVGLLGLIGLTSLLRIRELVGR